MAGFAHAALDVHQPRNHQAVRGVDLLLGGKTFRCIADGDDELVVDVQVGDPVETARGVDHAAAVDAQLHASSCGWAIIDITAMRTAMP